MIPAELPGVSVLWIRPHLRGWLPEVSLLLNHGESIGEGGVEDGEVCLWHLVPLSVPPVGPIGTWVNPREVSWPLLLCGEFPASLGIGATISTAAGVDGKLGGVSVAGVMAVEVSATLANAL
ncbi:uncharacterized protein A4U43_C08F8270 [Asparagus officinalis]|nr:uncharacterized protein A4U43_C08F8270 [Asparagus officinalis]